MIKLYSDSRSGVECIDKGEFALSKLKKLREKVRMKVDNDWYVLVMSHPITKDESEAESQQTVLPNDSSKWIEGDHLDVDFNGTFYGAKVLKTVPTKLWVKYLDGSREGIVWEDVPDRVEKRRLEVSYHCGSKTFNSIRDAMQELSKRKSSIDKENSSDSSNSSKSSAKNATKKKARKIQSKTNANGKKKSKAFDKKQSNLFSFFASPTNQSKLTESEMNKDVDDDEQFGGNNKDVDDDEQFGGNKRKRRKINYSEVISLSSDEEVVSEKVVSEESEFEEVEEIISEESEFEELEEIISEEEENDDFEEDSEFEERVPKKRRKQSNKNRNLSKNKKGKTTKTKSTNEISDKYVQVDSNDLFELSKKRLKKEKDALRKRKNARKANDPLNQRGNKADSAIQDGGEYFDPATLQGDMSSLPVEVLRRQFVTLWPLLSKAQKNGDFVFEYGKSKNLFEGITVQTACSGTDGPVIALQIFKEIATELRKRQETLCGEHWKFDYQHVMSCEIVPFKQAYLVRNFEDVKVFADIKEIAKSEAKTAFGGTVSVPKGNFFMAGTYFSTLRTSGKLDMLESKGISGETFFAACEFIFSQAQNWIIFENVDGAPWEQMEQYITGRLPLWSLYDKAKSGKKCGDLESTQNKSKENSQIMFTLSQDGRWETTHVPPKNGCRLGGILYAIDRGYTQRGHTADGSPIKKPQRRLVEKEKEIEVGTTMTIEQLASHLDCEMTLDTFVFEGPKDLLTGEIVFYRSQVVKCDTKEYGLPQVRRRKYMFVYRLDWVADIQDDLDEAGIDLGELFEELVECMQEPVNYALTAYVPDDTDPKVRRMRDRLRGPVGRKTARDELRNNSYYYNLTANVKHGVKMRNDCNLIERCDKDFSTKPITGWGERGKSKSIMYNLWPCMWDTVMTQRRRDMIDIFAMNQSAPVVLKHSDKCHDSLHTGYIWDLSQNATITTPHPATPGCSGCITPAGLSFLPQFGRMLTGGEKLAFQGIPIDRLQLGQETEMQLGDLAGNAMSLTVISAAMLAALSVKQFARERLANKKFLLKEPVPELLVTTTFAPPEKDKNVTYQKDSKELDAVSSFHDIAKLAYEAESASVLCVCETSGGSSASSILRCSNCNFTFCRSCASRGLDLACHKVCDYSVMHPTETSTASAGNKSRIGSVSFEQKLRCAAPSCLSLPSETEAKLIGNSDLSDSIFYLRKVKRKRGFWELTYVAAAQTGQLLGDFICCVGRVPELSSEISNYGMTAYVRLFPKGKRGILPPVVRRHFVVDDSGNIKPSTWETRNSFSLQVEVNGSEPTPSYRKTMGNKTFQTGPMSIWPKLIEFTVTNMETKENENEYNLLNDRIFKRLSCKGTINQNAIWQSKADLNKKDDIELFILIRPSSNRTSRVNMIVCSSRDYHRQGSLLAEFPTTFMPEVILSPDKFEKFADKKEEIEQKSIASFFTGKVSSNTKGKKRKLPPKKKKVTDRLKISMAVLRGGTQRVTTYTWTKTPQIKFIAPPQSLKISGPKDTSISGLDELVVSLVESIPFGTMKHISEPTRIEELMRTGSNNDQFIIFINGTGGTASQTRHRFADSLTAPLLQFSAKGKGIKSINSWQVLKQKSNDSDNCGQWGLNTIYSPKPPVAEFCKVVTRNKTYFEPKYDGMGSNEYEKALRAVPEPWHLKVDMEKRVMEIVASPCVPCHQVAADLLIGRHFTAAANVTVEWRVSGSATETIITGTTTADVASTSTFKVPTSSKYVETVPQDCKTPDQFVGKHPVTGDPLKLFPRQELALTRMVSMESGNVYFTEKELRQVPFRGLPSWVMEAKASRKVKLRGGVLADVMGGGKTATIIALIARSCEESRRERKRLQEEGKPWASSATLVIVPPNLTSSWHHEVKKFTRDKLAMVVIDDTENLLKITRKKLCEADIVIVNMAILIDGSGDLGITALEKKLKGSSFITYLSNLSKKSKFGELPIQLPKVSGFKAVDTLKGRTYVDHPANPYGGHGAQGVRGQNKRNDAAYFTSKYWESLSKLRKIKFSEDTKGIPLEWFSWTRLVFDECHEATCPPELEADFDEDEGSTKIRGKSKEAKAAKLKAMSKEKKSEKRRKVKNVTQRALAARELLGLAAEGDAERPLRARGGVWGLTGTPMLSSEDRVIELASMFRTYCIGQAKHWRRSERASRRDLFLQQLDSEGSIDYAIARREHAQEFINFAVQRNRATEFNGEKVEKICEVSMSAETSQKFHELSPQSAFAIGMKTDEVVCKNFNEIEILREIAPARSIKVAEIVRKIHVEDPVGKVVVFAPDADEAFNAVCKALSDAPGGMSFFNDETPASQRREIISSFASVDQLESDLKNPRVLVLPFSHAAGHNFQYVSCSMILVAPLWLGDDGVRAVANEQQAIGRIFRSGQLKKCTIYRVLLCGPNGEKTIDHSLYGVNTDASNIEAATSC